MAEILFHFEDLKQQAAEYLEEVRRQGRRILERAVAEAEVECAKIRFEAEEIRKNAEQQGFQQGVQQGLAEGRKRQQEEIAEQVQEKLQTELQYATTTVQKVLDEIDSLKTTLVATWEKGFLTLTCRVAERVVRRELERNPQIEAEWIRELLELCSGENAVTLRMHPDDMALLRSTLEGLQTRFRHLGTLEIRPDGTLCRGDCIVETEYGQMDSSISTQLNRIAEELE